MAKMPVTLLKLMPYRLYGTDIEGRQRVPGRAGKSLEYKRIVGPSPARSGTIQRSPCHPYCAKTCGNPPLYCGCDENRSFCRGGNYGSHSELSITARSGFSHRGLLIWSGLSHRGLLAWIGLPQDSGYHQSCSVILFLIMANNSSCYNIETTGITR